MMEPLSIAKKAVVLLSGGIDSSTALAIAHGKGYELYALSFDYSQRHKRELASAKAVAEAFNVKKHLTIHAGLGEIGGSALTSGIAVPKNGNGISKTVYRAEKDKPSSVISPIPVTYVPARNTVFLAFALAWAEVLNAGDIFIGANAVDYSGYPDCRPEYLQAFEHMANLATKASVEGTLRFRIQAPLVAMKKSEIIRQGTELGLDYSLTWSCYDPQPAAAGVQSTKYKVQSIKNSLPVTCLPPLVPCGKCDSCRLRARGFREAGIADPLGVMQT